MPVVSAVSKPICVGSDPCSLFTPRSNFSIELALEVHTTPYQEVVQGLPSIQLSFVSQVFPLVDEYNEESAVYWSVSIHFVGSPVGSLLPSDY